MVIENESRFSGDDGIAPFFAASPLTLLAQLRRERCCVINEGEIISSIVSTLFFVFLPTVSVWLCVRTYSTRAPLFFFSHVGVSGVCKCVGFSWGEKKKKILTLVFEEPNQRLANFPLLLCSSEANCWAPLPSASSPPSPFFCSLLSHLLSSLITEGAAGGLCSSLGLLLLASFIAVAPGETPIPNRKHKRISCKTQKNATVCISFIPTVGERGHEWVTRISWWHQQMIQSPRWSQRQEREGKGRDSNGYIYSLCKAVNFVFA